MEKIILNYDANAFKTAKIAFLKEKGCYEDGNAAAKTADFIEAIIQGNNR